MEHTAKPCGYSCYLLLLLLLDLLLILLIHVIAAAIVVDDDDYYHYYKKIHGQMRLDEVTKIKKNNQKMKNSMQI